MNDLVQRLRERHSFLCDEAADELDRLNAQALELCAELSGLRRENERLRAELRDHKRLLVYPSAADQPSAATENPEAMYNPVARGGHAGASARQIDVAAGDQLAAGQPERCCLDYPRCDCNSPPEPDDDWLCFRSPAQPKVTHER